MQEEGNSGGHTWSGQQWEEAFTRLLFFFPSSLHMQRFVFCGFHNVPSPCFNTESHPEQKAQDSSFTFFFWKEEWGENSTYWFGKKKMVMPPSHICPPSYCVQPILVLKDGALRGRTGWGKKGADVGLKIGDIFSPQYPDFTFHSLQSTTINQQSNLSHCWSSPDIIVFQCLPNCYTFRYTEERSH